MSNKKIVSVLVAAILACSFSTQALAEFFSLSAGVPVSHAIDNSNVETDGVSGYLVHFKLPIMLGIGMESYETKIKDAATTDTKLKTSMYDLFYLTPIPVINVTIGAGMGTVELECTGVSGNCSDYYEAGPATQFWGQLGFNVMPFLDLHLSYHSIQAKIKGKSGTDDVSVDGNLMALGLALIF